MEILLLAKTNPLNLLRGLLIPKGDYLLCGEGNLGKEFGKMAIRVAVAGAAGRMGREILRAVHSAPDMEVVAGADPGGAGKTLGEVAGIPALNIPIDPTVESAIQRGQPEVLIVFVAPPSSAVECIHAALDREVRLVIGSTGIADADIEKIKAKANEKKIGVFMAPNFAIGAVLMMVFAQKAARYMPAVEIIEFHHDGKLDAPSGTAFQTARKILEGSSLPERPPTEKFTVEGVRGGAVGPIHIHSVRLPGYVAHQEVILGGLGQTLTIRHDSISRESFMPGILMAVREVMNLDHFLYGLENLLEI